MHYQQRKTQKGGAITKERPVSPVVHPKEKSVTGKKLGKEKRKSTTPSTAVSAEAPVTVTALALVRAEITLITKSDPNNGITDNHAPINVNTGHGKGHDGKITDSIKHPC